MKIVLSILCLLLSPTLFAKEVTITKTWIPPTQNADGSELAVEQIKEFRLYYSIDGPIDLSGPYYATKENEAQIVLDLEPRQAPYVLRATVLAVDIWGGESEPSNEIMQEFSILSSTKPNPISNPKITITCGSGCVIEIAQ